MQGRLGITELVLKILISHIKTYGLTNTGLTEQVNAAVMLLACTWEAPVRIMFPTVAILIFRGFRNFGAHRLGKENINLTLVHSV